MCSCLHESKEDKKLFVIKAPRELELRDLQAECGSVLCDPHSARRKYRANVYMRVTGSVSLRAEDHLPHLVEPRRKV